MKKSPEQIKAINAKIKQAQESRKNKITMTHEEKIQYMEIATSMCHFGLRAKHLDLLVSLYELILAKEGNADMMDVAKVKAMIEGKYPDEVIKESC